MFLSKIAIFVLFLGPLVFFHELGHFLIARFFGVRVEVFSIGFGPKIIKFKRGFTEYAVSLIPLGGYVKMFGDDPFNKDSVAEEDREFSYNHKGKWARFCIVFGGPLANFILAYVIFFSLLAIGENLPEIKIGSVTEKSQFYKMGIRSGDVLSKINSNAVGSPNDIILEADSLIKTMTFKRQGQEIKLNVDIKPEDFFKEMTKYPPFLVQPIVKAIQGSYWAISTSKDSVNWKISLAELNSQKISTLYLHKIEKLLEIQETPILDFSVKPTAFVVRDMKIFKALGEKGYFPVDLVVKSVNMKSPADKAGLRAEDIITSVDGLSIYDFDSLRNSIQEKSRPNGFKLGIARDGEIITKVIVPEIKTISEKEVKLIGVYSAGRYIKGQYVQTPPMPIFKALGRSFQKTIDAVVKTVQGFKKLITAEVSFKNIGGPIAIGKVASDSFDTSLSYFFQLMALISVNLGVINLFPIPVLDGGHIVFIILETLNGGTLSRRKLEIAQQFGMSLLLLLMVGALFNDFVRFF